MVILFLGVQGLWAFDKDWFEYHIRASNEIPGSADVTVEDPVASNFGDSKLVNVTIAQIIRGRVRSQKKTVLLSPDEKSYFWGDSFDLSVDPDQERMNKFQLKNVHAKGSKNAPVTLVEFTDMQCPYCQKAHDKLSAELYKTYTKDQVRWVFKHFPLGMHNWAEPAHVALECAADQKKKAFWEMSEMFFRDAKDRTETKITKENVNDRAKSYAKELKLKVGKFEKCLSNEKMLSRVRRDVEEGSRVGVTSTPTIFVNGRKIRGFRNFSELKAVIDDKMTRSK